MVRTQPLSAGRDSVALEFLSHAPYDNVFLAYLILFDAAPATRAAIHIATASDGSITGVGYFGRQVVLAAADNATIEAFSAIGRKHRRERMIVGPRDTVARYWERVARGHVAPRVVRDRQFVMMLERSSLVAPKLHVVARRARMDEWPSVADNSAQMIGQELEYDPLRSSPEFTANVRAMIERGMWWVGESLGRLCFFCNIGPWSTQTAQLQGIWTPPELRGRGLATASLAAVCQRLLALSPTLSLYVNDFNASAITLYERVGFRKVSEFKTLLF